MDGGVTGVCAQFQTLWKPISQLEQSPYSATTYIHTQAFLYKRVSVSLMYKLRRESVCSLRMHIFNFIFPNYFPKLLKFIVAPAVDKILSFSAASPTLNIVGLFNGLQLKRCDMVSLMLHFAYSWLLREWTFSFVLPSHLWPVESRRSYSCITLLRYNI